MIPGLSLMTAYILMSPASPTEALAYLDPGSGSYMLQFLVAGLVGALFMVKVYWAKISAFFLGLVTPKRDPKK